MEHLWIPSQGSSKRSGKVIAGSWKADISDKGEVESVVDLSKELSELLTLHLNSEKNFTTPPIEAAVPGSTQHNHEDHEAMKALKQERLTAIRALEMSRIR